MQKIYGISLGPGDPELITLKGLKILQDSDLIFYPGSISREGRKDSYVLPMLLYHQMEEEKLRGFFIRMSEVRTHAEEVYAETFQEIRKAFEAGKKVAIVCEGDLSFYASFSYLLEMLQEAGISLELVPGINSFSLGAARHQVPICLQNEKVAILPRETSIEKVEQMLEEFSTVILMKIRSGWDNLSSGLVSKDWKFYYCERLGTPDEYISSNIREVQEREIPYFSLLIIKK